MKIDWKAVLEAVKEVGRLAFFAAISAIVAWASEELAGLDPTSVQVVVGTVILRFIDKWIHENEKTKLKGISPF